MNKESFLNKVESQFVVTLANIGSFPHITTLEVDDETGDSTLPLLKEIYGD